jgi:hypothetical protein
MIDRLKTNYLSLILWAILGVALGANGISLISAPTSFIVIMLLVGAIDLNSAYVMWRSCNDDK